MTVAGAALVLSGGRIVTCDPTRPQAEAVGVREGRIVAVGNLDEVLAAAGPSAEQIDLAGRTVVPGFIDAHNHFACTAETFAAIDARPSSAGSIAELVALVDHAAERTPRERRRTASRSLAPPCSSSPRGSPGRRSTRPDA